LALSKLLLRSRGGIQYVEHSEGHGEKLFEAVCDLGLEGIVSKRLIQMGHFDARLASRCSALFVQSTIAKY
jgi:ATP-dependent DNA ligase